MLVLSTHSPSRFKYHVTLLLPLPSKSHPFLLSQLIPLSLSFSPTSDGTGYFSRAEPKDRVRDGRIGLPGLAPCPEPAAEGLRRSRGNSEPRLDTSYH